jgi:hypothetical protein
MPTTRKVTTTTSRRTARTARGSTAAPGPEAIAARAYSLYLERGRTDGRDWDDWLQAEREILSASASGANAERP